MVKLDEVTDALEMVFDDLPNYLNRETGEIRCLPSEDTGWDDEMEELAAELETTTKWLRLPDQFAIHEWQIMRDFADEQPDPTRSQLSRALTGRGAYRHFKDSVATLGVRDRWFEYRRAALRQIAIDWCTRHDLPWEESR